MNRFQNLDVDQALRLIVEGTGSETGTAFYAALVKGLAATAALRLLVSNL
jgi:predicted YcjX-like family ATPase